MREVFDRTLPGNVFQTVRTLFPLLVMAAAGSVNAVVDRIFLSRFSDLAVQAVVPAAALAGTLSVFFLMTAGYSSTFIAQQCGRGNRKGAERAFVQGLGLSLLFLPCLLACVPAGRFFLETSGHGAALVAAERSYFDIVMPAKVLELFALVIGGYFNGQGRTNVVGLSGTLGSMANMVLDPLLIFGFGFVPSLGLVGAAWATVGASVVSCGFLLFKLGDSRRCVIRAIAPKQWDLALMGRIFRFGAPNGLMNAVGASFFSVFVMRTGHLDALSLAVSNIAFGINSVYYVIVCGVRDGETVLVGRFRGQNDFSAIRRTYIGSLLLALVSAAAVGGGAWILAPCLAGLFRAGNSQFGVVAFASTLSAVLAVLALRMATEAVAETTVGLLKGVGDTSSIMWVRIGSGLCIWMPLVWILSCHNATIVGYWLTMPIHLGITALLLVIRFYRGRWRAISLVS